MWYKKILAISVVVFVVTSCKTYSINIQHSILRDRVVVQDRVLIKKALYVAFVIAPKDKNLAGTRIYGTLASQGRQFSETTVLICDGTAENLVFDLPDQMPQGEYVTITVSGQLGDRIVQDSKVLGSTDIANYSESSSVGEAPFKRTSPPCESFDWQPTGWEREGRYVVFSRPPLTYVYPESKPTQSELITSLDVKMVRNEFEPLTFSLYAFEDLGKVSIAVSDLRAGRSLIPRAQIEPGYIESVDDTTGLGPGEFRDLPTLIRPGEAMTLEAGRSSRFWLTVYVGQDVLPGVYRGFITITPERGRKTSLPVTVEVAPITLENVPGVDYCMLMTYDFTELTMPWAPEEKAKIREQGIRIVNDFKKHGMTTVCPHSPFVLVRNSDCTPNLDDLFALLRAAKDTGLTRPIVWYMGHLIQTAKPKHPGNILLFDRGFHLERLRSLVRHVADYATRNGLPEVVFLPIDEPDDAYQDWKGMRQDITDLLLDAIHEESAQAAVTGGSYSRFKTADCFISNTYRKEELELAHKNGSRYWIYNNDVTTNSTNPAHARYIYGYYTWKTGIDGMSSWTYQNTQNASGWPTKADRRPGRDLYLAYPDARGPLSTLKWEAIREGIEDHKLAYQLAKRIAALKKNGLDASKYEEFLEQIRVKPGEPGLEMGDYRGWDPPFFAKTREELIRLVVEADRLLDESARLFSLKTP